MAGSVNKVILIGHLGRDPEVRYTPGGQAVANFSVATNDNWTDKSGQKQERTEWHRVVAWGKTAELCGGSQATFAGGACAGGARCMGADPLEFLVFLVSWCLGGSVLFRTRLGGFL